MAPKSKPASANGAKPVKAAAVAKAANGSADAQVDVSPAGTLSRPDKAAYDAEQEKLKKEIDELQTKLVRPFVPLAFVRRPDRIRVCAHRAP